MKKIYSVLLLLFACVMGASAEKEIYAVYNGDVLTIQYDENREANNGATQWWESIYSSQRKAVTQIVIDASMADARPERTKGWFGGYENLEQISGMENLNTSVTTDMQDMFSESGKLTSIDLSHMETRYVRSMGGMFMNCESLKELNLFNFNISFLEDVEAMFAGCSNLERIYSTINWEMSDQITKSDNMFYGCEKLRGGNGTLFDPDYVDKRYARPDHDGQPGYFTESAEPDEPEAYAAFDELTGTLTYYYDTKRGDHEATVLLPLEDNDFYNAHKDDIVRLLVDPSFHNAPLESSKGLFHLFAHGSAQIMPSVKKIDGLEYINTETMTDLTDLFARLTSIEELDLTVMDLSHVTIASGMFWGCYKLKKIICDEDLSNVTDGESMFLWCESLVGGKGTACDGEHYINAEYARLDKPGQPGYFSEKPQGLEQTSQEPIANSQKLIKDGQLFIERGGKLFNVTGAEVK